MAGIEHGRLAAQAKLLYQRAVPGDVLACQVLEQPPAAADEEQQPAAAVVVVLMHLEVLSKTVDSLRQERDLDFRRAGVTLTGRVRCDDLLLNCGVERQRFVPLVVVNYPPLTVRHKWSLRQIAEGTSGN